KEQQTNVWTITLQDKAWGGYTLVLTYDYQFDPKGSTLDLAGAHTLGVERETTPPRGIRAGPPQPTPPPPRPSSASMRRSCPRATAPFARARCCSPTNTPAAITSTRRR